MYVCMYAILGTSGGESGFGTSRCYANIKEINAFRLLFQMHVCIPLPPSVITVTFSVILFDALKRDCCYSS